MEKLTLSSLGETNAAVRDKKGRIKPTPWLQTTPKLPKKNNLGIFEEIKIKIKIRFTPKFVRRSSVTNEKKSVSTLLQTQQRCSELNRARNTEEKRSALPTTSIVEARCGQPAATTSIACHSTVCQNHQLLLCTSVGEYYESDDEKLG